jgi:hypothetical protein
MKKQKADKVKLDTINEIMDDNDDKLSIIEMPEDVIDIIPIKAKNSVFDNVTQSNKVN